MKLYDGLRDRIKTISRDNAEYLRFCNLITLHFEGKQVFEQMPDVLKLAVAEWENEQKEN